MKFCISCKKDNQDDESACIHCGGTLISYPEIKNDDSISIINSNLYNT